MKRVDGRRLSFNSDTPFIAARILIAADNRAISERPNMLVKQNLLLISNKYSMRMAFYRVKAIEPNFVFMQVKEVVYRGMGRFVKSRGFVSYFFSCVYLLKHNILCSPSKKNTGYGMNEGLQFKQREASFPHYNPIFRKELDGIAVKTEAMLMAR